MFLDFLKQISESGLMKKKASTQGYIVFVFGGSKKFHFNFLGFVSLFPYMTIHIKSLGINVVETSVIYSLVPLATIFGPPIFGLFADRIGNFRVSTLPESN